MINLRIYSKNLISLLCQRRTLPMPHKGSFPYKAVSNIVETTHLFARSSSSRTLCKKSNIPPSTLLPTINTLASHALQSVPCFSPNQLTTVAWSFAKVGRGQKPLFNAITKQARKNLAQFQSEETLCMAWSFVVAGHYPRQFMRAAVQKLQQQRAALDQNKGCMQLLQIKAALDLECPSLKICWHKKMRTLLQQYTEQLACQKPCSSLLHGKVATSLQNLNVPFCNEYFVSPYFIDIALPHKKIAIEVNGPCHYISYCREPLGPTLFKVRLLQKMGWACLTLPYWEIDACCDAAALQSYLLQKISLVAAYHK